MIRAIDVGQYIYSKMDWVDAWRLQKLTYYAQAWTLAWTGRELIEDDFQAWPDGPVSPRLHQANKFDRDGWYSTAIPGAHPENLTGEQQMMIDAVLAHYGELSKDEIVALVHSEDPWKTARAGLPAEAKCDAMLSKAEMKRFYAVQQFSGGDVPAQPRTVQDIASQKPVDKQFATMMGNCFRWADTLELLADR